tara:strand:- start:35993 stop:37474 length:1482 start_codon:yes stop_codon:yes gene_type:complete
MSYISGTPISNCGTIAFGTNATVRIQFTINLSKQQNQVVGTSNLFVYTIGSSGSRIERSNTTIQPVNFVTNFQTSADITMSQTDFNNSGGTLFAVFKSSGNIEYQTACSYSITKTNPPSFTLSPTTLPLPCGDTSSRTFTVTPANIPSGAVVTYQWSHNGWSQLSATATSKTLQPNSGTTLPSSVIVTPFINGVSQGTRTSTVTRAPFTTTATISAANSLCSGTTTVSLANFPSGSSTDWSVTGGSLVSIVGQNNTSLVLQRNGSGSGEITISALISNACNQTITLSKSMFVGSPQLSYDINEDLTICRGENTILNNTFIVNISGSNNQTILEAQKITNNHNLFVQGNEVIVSLMYTPPYNYIAFKVRVNNDCGFSDWLEYYVQIIENCSGGGGSQNNFAIFPSPADTELNITVNNVSSINSLEKRPILETLELQEIPIIAGLYDFEGRLVIQQQFSRLGDIQKIDVSDLKKGIYILKIIAKELEETHRIIIE